MVEYAPSPLLAAGALVAWFFSNMALTLLMKVALSHEFHFPVTISAMHMCFVSLFRHVRRRANVLFPLFPPAAR